MTRIRKGKVRVTRYPYENRSDASYQLGSPKSRLFKVGNSHYGRVSRGEKRRAAKKRYYREGSFITYHGTGNPNHKKPGLIPVRGIR